MNIKNNSLVSVAFAALAVFGVLGWCLAFSGSNNASAETSVDAGAKVAVDRPTLDSLFDSIFHRPVDASGAGFFVGKNLKDVLRDIMTSPEHRYYGALFKAVKSYEEAQRAPGTLTADEKASQLALINSALSNLLAWVDTLPDQDPCIATVSPEQAKQAIEDAHNNLDASAQVKSENGVFSSSVRIGRPINIPLHPRCLSRVVPTTPPPTCHLRPACLDATPQCLMPEPIGGWCSATPTPTI